MLREPKLEYSEICNYIGNVSIYVATQFQKTLYNFYKMLSQFMKVLIFLFQFRFSAHSSIFLLKIMLGECQCDKSFHQTETCLDSATGYSHWGYTKGASITSCFVLWACEAHKLLGYFSGMKYVAYRSTAKPDRTISPSMPQNKVTVKHTQN
jgi:hypothetical protein